jgi:hypothetical protein
VIDPKIRAALNVPDDYQPVPRRGLHVERGTWGFGFYKVGISWVAYLKLPRFGMIHWSHWSAWHVVSTFPMALFRHAKFVATRRTRNG